MWNDDIYGDAPGLDADLAYDDAEYLTEDFTEKQLLEYLAEDPYSDAKPLDLNLEWPDENLDIYEAYSTDRLSIDVGSIWFAKVHQDAENPIHEHRPFVITYMNAKMVYGFQLTKQTPTTKSKYIVPISDWKNCGLRYPSNFSLDYFRGVPYNSLEFKVGHLTEHAKKELLDKLYEIKYDPDGDYLDCPFNDRIDMTIANVERIPVAA